MKKDLKLDAVKYETLHVLDLYYEACIELFDNDTGSQRELPVLKGTDLYNFFERNFGENVRNWSKKDIILLIESTTHRIFGVGTYNFGIIDYCQVVDSVDCNDKVLPMEVHNFFSRNFDVPIKNYEAYMASAIIKHELEINPENPKTFTFKH